MLRALAVAATFAATSFVNAGVLYNNGPFVTNPTGGTGSIAGLPISNADGFNIPGQSFLFSTTGVAATVATNTAAADDFTVPAGQTWDLNAVTLYAFQTSQATPSVSKIEINLWRATPYSAGSPTGPIPDPLPTPVLASRLILDAGPGTLTAHRQSPSGTSTVRPVFAYTVSLDGLPDAGVLGSGTYWLEFSMRGASSPSANVFTPLVTRSAVTDRPFNARLFNSVSGAANDPRVWFEGREGFVAGVTGGRAYELPFVLDGTVVPEPGLLATAVVAGAGLLQRRRRAVR